MKYVEQYIHKVVLRCFFVKYISSMTRSCFLKEFDDKSLTKQTSGMRMENKTAGMHMKVIGLELHRYMMKRSYDYIRNLMLIITTRFSNDQKDVTFRPVWPFK